MCFSVFLYIFYRIINYPIIDIEVYGQLNSLKNIASKSNVVSAFKTILQIQSDEWVDKLYISFDGAQMNVLVHEKIPFANLFDGENYYIVDVNGNKIIKNYYKEQITIIGHCNKEEINAVCHCIARSKILKTAKYMIMLSPRKWKICLDTNRIVLCDQGDLELLDAV